MVFAPAEGGPLAYTAETRLVTAQPQGIVLMCSDHRYRAATEEFVSKRLGLASFRQFAVPGGAYMLSFADALPKQLKVGTRMLKFMMKDGAPGRVILIAHQDCLRYLDSFASKLGRFGFRLEDRQKGDLLSVRTELAEMFPGASIEAYFARAQADRVTFEAV